MSLVEADYGSGRIRWRHTKSRRRAQPSLRGASVALALAITQPAWADDPAPIKIGVIAEAQAVAGSSIPQAAQIAADEINAKGGVDGRKIEIVSYDNHSSSAEFGARVPARRQRGSRQCGDRQLHQRGRAGARTVGRAPEDRLHYAGRRVRRHHAEHRQGLRAQQIHVPRLSDLGRALGACVRRRQGHAGRRPQDEDGGDHERGRRLDWAARRRLRGLPAEDRAQSPGPRPLLARHHRFHPDLQQDRGLEARRDHHRRVACRHAADGAMEKPAGADPDVRHRLAGDQLDLLEGHQRRDRRRDLPGRLGSGRRGHAQDAAVRRRVQRRSSAISRLCRLHRLR